MRTLLQSGSILFIAVLLLPSTGNAEDAKALLKRGNNLFSSGEYIEAYKVFEEGYKADPKPVFLRSMAFSKLKTYKHKKARELLQEYLKKFPKVKDRKKIKDLVASLDVVVQTQLSIESTPAGAKIYIDAEAAGKVGTTPTDLTIQPGKHLLILKADNYFETTQAFEIKAKESKRIKVILEVPLAVTSEPSGATVHLGAPTSASIGKTPLNKGIKPGPQKIFVKLDGYKTYQEERNVEGGKECRITAAMQLGIKIASTPPGATVTIDDKPVEGVTPLESGITTGSHTVVIKLAGYKPVTRQVEAAPGKVADLDVTLSGGAALTMHTDVAGAVVKLGDRELGKTPLDGIDIPSGNRTITVSHPDRRSWSRALDFSETEAVEAQLALGRPTWPVWVAGGATVAGAVLGAITGLMAKNKAGDSANLISDLNGNGKPDGDEPCAVGDCGQGLHHASTASFIAAGVAAAFGAVYYIVFARHKETITRKPVSGTASR